MTQIDEHEELAVLLSAHQCALAAAAAKTVRDLADESNEDNEDQQFIDELDELMEIFLKAIGFPVADEPPAPPESAP